ncbi:MAG: metalloregulator ArsR/SmtB family transcription factor [Aliifodinibius sp.]|nr:metalloregulator ArsR/SmtB family transcription factor [Fodinibius sp.]
MVQSKLESFTEEEIQLANIAKALAHPARIKILKILVELNVCMCGEIVSLLPLSQSTVSQHLKELKKAGLIEGEIEGPKMCYCVDNEMLKAANQAFGSLFSNICNC